MVRLFGLGWSQCWLLPGSGAELLQLVIPDFSTDMSTTVESYITSIVHHYKTMADYMGSACSWFCLPTFSLNTGHETKVVLCSIPEVGNQWLETSMCLFCPSAAAPYGELYGIRTLIKVFQMTCSLPQNSGNDSLNSE